MSHPGARRVKKTLEGRLADFESHLRFLREAIGLYYSGEEDRYKQIAAELRVLVCETRTNHPLLLDLMDENQFVYEVQPHGPPYDDFPVAAPIPMVGWRDDPQHQELTREFEAAAGDESKLDEVLEKQAAMRRPLPLREYVNKALAVYIVPKDFSYRDLTLAIAQQLGSSHEDTAVDEEIAKMHLVLIGGEESHVAALVGFANLVLAVGFQFFQHLIDHHGYTPHSIQPSS